MRCVSALRSSFARLAPRSVRLPAMSAAARFSPVGSAAYMPTSSQLAFARTFASAQTVGDKSSTSGLVEALEREIEAEKQLDTGDEQGKCPVVKGFDMKNDRAEVRLTKKHGNETILVHFNVNHTVDVSEGDEDFASENMEQHPNPDAAPTPVSMPPFSVEIIKGDERFCFQLAIVQSPSDEGDEHGYDFTVEEFYIAPAAKNATPEGEQIEDAVYSSSGKYIDPDLHEQLFVKYLDDRGINPEFCEQLVNLSTYYEHQQYIELLKRIKAFVAKK